MNTIRLGWSALLGFLLLQHASGQVPHVVSYQGRLTAHGTNFDGTGFLKFALVSGATNAATQATASATLTYGFLVQIAVTSAGSGYTAPPAVTITDPTGSGALAVAQVSGGQVTGITVLDAGSGYTAPVVNIAPPATAYNVTTFWSNDGTGSAGGEPAQPVAVHVAQGLFTVLLGDTTLSNMAPIPPAVFAYSDVRLRIWFSDGTGGFQVLGPDQRIAAVGYAMMAGAVPDGSITASKLADASITTAKLAPEAHQDLRTPSGSIALSDKPDATNLVGAGYARVPGVGPFTTEEWTARPVQNQMPINAWGSEVWAGSELILWGGSSSFGELLNLNTGARFSVVSNAWSSTSLLNALQKRIRHSAVWTGSEMLVWGGATGVAYGTSTTLDSGGRYSPALDRWLPITQSNAPAARVSHSAVWSGTEMIVWGGARYYPTGLVYLADGGRYNPDTDAWVPISTNGAPSPRYNHDAVWTGTEMVVWGGSVYTSLIDGARYSPATDTWRPMNTNGAPGSGPFFIWTGSEIIVGKIESPVRYDPALDRWTSLQLPLGASVSGRAAVWTGTEIIGGSYRYTPASGQWLPMSGPPGYWTHLYWTGSELIAFTPGASLTYSCRPSPPLYLFQKL